MCKHTVTPWSALLIRESTNVFFHYMLAAHLVLLFVVFHLENAMLGTILIPLCLNLRGSWGFTTEVTEIIADWSERFIITVSFHSVAVSDNRGGKFANIIQTHIHSRLFHGDDLGSVFLTKLKWSHLNYPVFYRWVCITQVQVHLVCSPVFWMELKDSRVTEPFTG